MKLFVVQSVGPETLFLLAKDKDEATAKARTYMIRKIISREDWSIEDCALEIRVRAASPAAALAFNRATAWRDHPDQCVLSADELANRARR